MRRQGFTLVEVMVALGVMTIGAMSLIAMQQQATRANVRARDVTVATQIAQNVIERLKIESLVWTTLSTNPVQDLVNCKWFLQPVANVGNVSRTTANNLFKTLPVQTVPSGGISRVLSNAFDYNGVDVLPSGATAEQVRFCASYRLAYVYDDFRSLRADVRVWWSKEAPTRDILGAQDFVGCQDNDADLNPGGRHYDNYHVVYLSTVLRPGVGP